ncbi:unnamed protein product, partial [Ascophyllum nodosum]
PCTAPLPLHDLVYVNNGVVLYFLDYEDNATSEGASCVSTASKDALEETLSSLDHAMKAKSIENKPVANQKLSKTHL